MIKAVFFDVGNTLFFYNYQFLSDLLAERFDIELDPRELEAVHYSLGEELHRTIKEQKDHPSMVREVYRIWFSELDIDEERIPKILDAVVGHPFRYMFWAKMGAEVRETLEWFKERNYKLGIISNAEGQIKRLLEHAKLTDYFDVILDSKEVGIEKPDERIFHKALEEIGVEPGEAVHVGDLIETDIIGAQRAGVLPVLIDREGRHDRLDVLRVRRVSEVVDLPIFQRK